MFFKEFFFRNELHVVYYSVENKRLLHSGILQSSVSIKTVITIPIL